MAGCGLVCVGHQDSPLPEEYHGLWASGAFEELITLPEIPKDPESYWTTIVPQLPRSLSTALVIPEGIELTDDLLRLGTILKDRVCAAFPMALAHEVAGSLMSPHEEMHLSALDVNVWLNRYALGRSLELPVLGGFCGWIDVSALRAAAQEVEHDIGLAHWLREQGHSILLSDQAFVGDACLPRVSLKSVGLPESQRVALQERHPFTAIRHPLSELSRKEKRPPADLGRGPAAILHISHSWGGGLGRWITDFCAADKDHLHIILKSIGTREASAQALALYLGDAPAPLKQWSLTTPFQSTSLGSWEYRQILREIQASFTIRGVVISSLIGHSMDIYEEPWPIIQVLHDYYPWCPPLYATWGDPCTQCDKGRLSQCLQSNPAHQFFGEEQVDWFIAVREQLVSKLREGNIPVVAPSQSVKHRWQQLAPSLEQTNVRIVAHGLPTSEIEAFAEHRWQASSEAPLHIVVLGVLSEHKGMRFLLELLPEWLERHRVTLLGTGENAPSLPSHNNLTVIKWFQLPDLPRQLQALKPDVGLLLSKVPETFSYTLSELFASGIPPVATNLGAFSDRIQPGVNGWLVAPKQDAIRECVDWLDHHRDELGRVREALLLNPQRSSAEMAAEYLALLPKCKPSEATRPLCRSVVADAGVGLDQGEPSENALFVRPGATYRRALFQFLLYSHRKTQESPKFSRVSKRLLSLCLRVAIRLAKPR